MTHEPGFLSAILADPADDALRLIYADRLEDRGDPRGDFVRVQCRLALHERAQGDRSGWADSLLSYEEKNALRHRERELLEAHGFDWLTSDLGSLAGILNRDDEFPDWLRKTYRRGFVASITLTMAAWCGEACLGCSDMPWNRSCCDFCHGTGRVNARGPALVRAAPLTEVRLSGWHLNGEDGRWFFSGVHSSDWPELLGRAWDRRYSSAEEARANESASCLKWARLAAELADVRAELAAIPRWVPGMQAAAAPLEDREKELAALVG